ncbi:hypothetical protein [Paraburkholderia terrae]
MLIRDRVLELLEEGDGTVTELADRLGALTNTVSKAVARAREDGDAHIVSYLRQAAVYRRGAGIDAPRPATPDPVAPAEKRYDARSANVRGIEMPIYFELEGGLLPGVRHFACDRLRAKMSISSCGTRWEKANSTDVDADRFHTCRRCPIGAAHAGRSDHNSSPFKGMTICGRCHRGATRLIGKHLCISCFNRARELRIGKNAKGTRPIKLAKLEPRSITYRAGGVVKTRTIAETVDTDELIVAVLRDEERAPQFAYRAPASMGWLLDNDAYDRSIGDAADVAEPVPPTLDVVQADPAADIDAHGLEHDVDPLETVRRLLLDDVRDTPVPPPSLSKRAAKRQRQAGRRQVRVSSVTVQLMRGVGALPPAPPVVVPVLEAQPFYCPTTMSCGAAFG